MRVLKDAEVRELVALYQRSRDACEDYSTAVKVRAEKCGCEPAYLRRAIVAVARDRVIQARDSAQGVLDLLDAIAPDECPIVAAEEDATGLHFASEPAPGVAVLAV